MIIEAFLEWLETAKTNDRARAAEALASAWRKPELMGEDRRSVRFSMTCLLDDASPRVRLALARAIAGDDTIPREIALPLAHDQPEIAFAVISGSPVLADTDLIEIAARGDDHSAAFVAARRPLSVAVSAAIAEIGDEPAVTLLLENPDADIARGSLTRIVERLGASAEIRMLVEDREDLPPEARRLLVEHVAEALRASSFVRNIMGDRRIERVRSEATHAAVVDLASDVEGADLVRLVDHLRRSGVLSPAFLIQALCRGRFNLFATAITALAAMPERRVLSLIGDGRFHAIRALYETAGLSRDLAEVFVEATLVWREFGGRSPGSGQGSLFAELKRRQLSRGIHEGPAAQLLDMVERLEIAERRSLARALSQDILAAEAA